MFLVGTFHRKPHRATNSGLLLTIIQKWNVSTFLRFKAAMCGYTAEVLLKHECWTGTQPTVGSGEVTSTCKCMLTLHSSFTDDDTDDDPCFICLSNVKHYYVQAISKMLQHKKTAFTLRRSSADCSLLHSGIACPRFWVGVVVKGCEIATAD